MLPGLTATRAHGLVRHGVLSRVGHLRATARGIRPVSSVQSRALSAGLGRGFLCSPHIRVALVAAGTPSPHLNRLLPNVRCLANATSEVAKPSAIQEASGRDLVLSPPALVVTREYEWANILVGFEQANKYSIRAAPGGQVVGYLAEVC